MKQFAAECFKAFCFGFAFVGFYVAIIFICAIGALAVTLHVGN